MRRNELQEQPVFDGKQSMNQETGSHFDGKMESERTAEAVYMPVQIPVSTSGRA